MATIALNEFINIADFQSVLPFTIVVSNIKKNIF